MSLARRFNFLHFPALLFLAGSLCWLVLQHCTEAEQPEPQNEDIAKESRDTDSLDRWLLAHRSYAYDKLCLQDDDPQAALRHLEQCIRDMNAWRQPRNVPEYTALCKLYLMEGYIAKQFVENYAQAKVSFEKAYEIFMEQLNGRDDAIAGFLFFQLGNSYVRMGEFESAEKLFKQGLDYSLRYNVPETAKYPDYGGMYSTLGEYAKALPIFYQGLRHPGIPESDLLFTRLSLAECLARMGRYPEAIQENEAVKNGLEKLLASGKEVPKMLEYQRYLAENEGIIYTGLQQPAKALAAYQKAVKIEDDNPLGTRRIKALFYVEIGTIFLKTNQPDSALQAFHEALQRVIPGYEAPVSHIPSPALFSTENVIYRALEGKARSFEQLGQLEKALVCYERIPVVEAKLRATHDYESSTLRALQASRARIDKAIGLAWRLSGNGANETYAKRAFELAEHARAIILMERLSTARAVDQLPETVKAREFELQYKIAWHERELAAERAKGEAQDALRYKQLDDTLYQLKKDLSKFKTDYPAYGRTLEALEYIRAEDVPALLPAQSALVEYYLNADTADLYIFCITNTGNYTWRREVWSAGKQEQVTGLTAFVGKLDESREAKLRYIGLADSLYSLLLRPELDKFSGLESLAIVPDDVLAFLPFEILLTQKENPTRHYADFHYLIIDKSISYNYSVTLLRLQQQIKTDRQAASSLGVFAPKYSRKAIDPHTGSVLVNLDSIQDAVQRVRKMLRVADSQLPPATETGFRKYAPDVKVLILGMHGFTDLKFPELSRLIFGNPDTSALANQDNILYAKELQALRLQAELAVLLACKTGDGKLEGGGEGVYNFARAFALAGVPTTLISLWNLPDRSAPLLMRVYFENLIGNARKDKALQAAKIAYLSADEKADQAHPFFWAGLMNIGTIDPLDLEPASGLPDILILLGAGLALAGLLFAAWRFWISKL